jgi:PBP1b-binding outer membrane lipoprotein LpoB
MINGTIIITNKLMSSSGGSFNIKRTKKTQTFIANHQNSRVFEENNLGSHWRIRDRERRL